jgi:hypothetical protein
VRTIASTSAKPISGHRLSVAPIAMTNPRTRRRRRKGGILGALSSTFTDPHRASGSIDATTRQIDPTRAVLLERVAVAEVGMEREGKGERVLALEVAGKVNTTEEVGNFLLLCTPDAAALLVAQTVELARRGLVGPEFEHALENQMKEAAG